MKKNVRNHAARAGSLLNRTALTLTALIVLSPASRFAAGAERTKLVYLSQPLLIEDVGGKAVGPAADLMRVLVSGLANIDDLTSLPVKRLELALTADNVIAVGLARTPRRVGMGFAWVVEIYADDYRFASLAGHPPVTTLENARVLRRVACNVRSAPAEFLIDHGFTNLENAQVVAEAEMLRAGRVDAWFERGSFIRATWRSLGFDMSELQWSGPFPAPTVWIAASSKVDPALLDTIRERFVQLRRQGKLDAIFSGVAGP